MEGYSVDVVLIIVVRGPPDIRRRTTGDRFAPCKEAHDGRRFSLGKLCRLLTPPPPCRSRPSSRLAAPCAEHEWSWLAESRAPTARRGMFSNARSANSPKRKPPATWPLPGAIALPGSDESSVGGIVHQPLDLLICFTFESVASIEAASSRMAFDSSSIASFSSCERAARSA